MDLLSKETNEFLKSIFDEQLSHEKNGDYVKAEECRLKFEKNKNDRERKTIHDMQVEHKKQQDQLTSSYNDEVTKFNEYWDNKLAEFDKNSENMVKELSAKHQMDQQKTKDELDKQLSLKVKESSDLLNLRKMQEHLVKQKNYPEAHKVQEQAKKLFNQETHDWNAKRDLKIATTINTLKHKQNNEMKNLQQRIHTTRDEQEKDRTLTSLKMKQKYDNNMKDLKVAQEKDILAFKGEFRNLGGTASSSPSKTKSSMGSTK